MTASRVTNGALTAGAATVQLTARYQYIELMNLDAAASADVMYARTDGTVPVSPWDDCVPVTPGDRVLLANQNKLWYQSFGATDGTQTNPGTTVKIASTNAASTAKYSVAGTG